MATRDAPERRPTVVSRSIPNMSPGFGRVRPMRPPLNRRRARCATQAIRTNARAGIVAVRSVVAVMPRLPWS